MKELLIYLLQTSVLVTLGYAVYTSVFGRDANHGVKRFVLLSVILLSFALPVCRITIHKVAVLADDMNPVAANLLNLPVPAETNRMEAGQGNGWDWLAMAGILYVLGVITQLAYRLLGIRRAKKVMKKAVGKRIYNGIEVLIVPESLPAFSFGNRIVISQEDLDKNAGMILAHESVHVKQRHSADLLLVNVALSLQWFNPFLWLLRRELILTHEFLADRGVLQSGIDAKTYQYLILSKSVLGSDFLPVVNHFRSGDLHKRIRTMKRKPSKEASLKLLIFLPLVSLALVAFAETKQEVKAVQAMDTEEVEIPEKESFHMPYRGRIRVEYGKQITDPANGRRRTHKGIDVVVANDTVRAPYSGLVIFAADARDGYGNKLVVAHKDGLETMYAHLAKSLVSEGASVTGGQPIAIVGSTGRSTGKHLHLECRINGELVDPASALPLSGQ